MTRRRRRGWFARLRQLDFATAESRDMNDPTVHTPGTFIDSWHNMPGGQPDDDQRPTVSDLKGVPRPGAKRQPHHHHRANLPESSR